MSELLQEVRDTLGFRGCMGLALIAGIVIGMGAASIAVHYRDSRGVTLHVDTGSGLSDVTVRQLTADEIRARYANTVRCTVWRANGVPFFQDIGDDDPIAATLRSRVPAYE